MIQDADRLAFALAEGPAAALVAEHLTDRLWTRGSDGDDWPAPVLDWLTDGDTFASAPDGLTGFITGGWNATSRAGASSWPGLA